MIDARIPLMAQGIDSTKMLENGSKIADYWLSNETEGELSRIYKESQGDLGKMMQLGQQSKMARWVMPQLQAQQAAQQKAALDTQKTQADIAKTQSETLDNNDKVAQSRLSAMYKAIGHAAMTGDKNAAIYAANAAQSAGAITPEQYTESIGILNSMDSAEKIKQYATSVQQMLSQDPAKFNSTTADNRLDNETSRFNNAATVGATLSGQQLQREIAAANSQQAAQKTELKDIGGYQAIFYPQTGEYEFVRDANGQPMKSQQKSTGQPKLSDKALSFVNEANVQIATSTQNLNKVQGIIKDINDGKLNLNAASQGSAWLMNRVGLSDENTRGIENFKTALNQAANDVLMMAKGTQTEGDAKRALETIVANPPRDNKAALQALQRLATIQQNTINVLNSNIDGVYQNYGIARPQANNAPQPSYKNVGQGKPNARSFFD